MINRRYRKCPGLAAFVFFCSMSAPAIAAIDYTMGYLSLPGKVQFIESDLTTGIQEQQSESLKFGSAAFRLGISLPRELGPFQAAVESGFSLPLSTASFDHRKLVRNPPVGASRNDTNDGDITNWRIISIPVYFVLRYAPPTDAVSLGGQVSAGPVVLGVVQEQVESIYAAGGALDREITIRSQTASVAFGVEAAVGLEIPATQELTLRLLGGAVWMSRVAYTTLDRDLPPASSIRPESEVYGDSAGLPGLELGGLGFIFRGTVSIGI